MQLFILYNSYLFWKCVCVGGGGGGTGPQFASLILGCCHTLRHVVTSLEATPLWKVTTLYLTHPHVGTRAPVK